MTRRGIEWPRRGIMGENRKMPLYRVNFTKGMFLVNAETNKQAKAYCRKKYGLDGWPYFVAPATEEDIEHYKEFKGRIHDATVPEE